FTFSQFAWCDVGADTQKPDWSAFSKNLVRAMKTPCEGLQLSAMQQIITYADNLHTDSAVFEVMRFYRNHQDDRVRVLALNTLHRMKNKWAMGFLRVLVEDEKSEVVKRHIYFILADCER
ncbi:hypothetical protein GWN42_22610, partial [candidate division KSB1 bacterium]|nr:hypothetical protein [candidate division KSB1 bacterium]